MDRRWFTLLMFGWSSVLGGLLGTIRNFMAGYAGNAPLPAPAEFLIRGCCSHDLNAPYFTFFEIMTIATLLMLPPTLRRGTQRRLRAQLGAFIGLTIFAALSALLMLTPLNTFRSPEVLNPPMRPTVIATTIHCLCLGMLAAALLYAGWRLVKRWRKRRKKEQHQ